MSDDRSSRLLQRGLDILELLAAQHEPLGIRDLAQRLDLSPSTCHRLLNLLQERDYVMQDERTRHWTLTLKLYSLGARKLNQSTLPGIARPHLEQLMQQTNETVFLGVRDGDNIVYIDEVLSQQAASTAVTLGSSWPLHSGAPGKMLLSSLPDIEIERILGSELVSITPKTIIDPARLWQQITEIRTNDYALNYGETVPGVFVVAAPLRDHSGTVVAAVGSGGPHERIGKANEQRLIALVQATARTISEHLGYLRDEP